jgi:hypothetical protein
VLVLVGGSCNTSQLRTLMSSFSTRLKRNAGISCCSLGTDR